MKFKRLVKIDVTTKEYFKVEKIYGGIYPMGIVYIQSNKDDTKRQIQFECSTFKVDKLLHDVNLARRLGVELRIEII